MDVEQAYFASSWLFDTWVRLMESHTRKMEVADSTHLGSKILIISPPTDPGMGILTNANRSGETSLLCFSKRTERIAIDYCAKHSIEGLVTKVAPFFHIPFADGELAAVYANCFFDFCRDTDFDLILDEIWRVLKRKGSHYAVYMGPPESLLAGRWEWILRRFHRLGQGCHPVRMAPYLSRRGFRILKDCPAQRLGFPIWYTHAEKPA